MDDRARVQLNERLRAHAEHHAQPPESHHPTARGQQVLADLVDEHLRSPT